MQRWKFWLATIVGHLHPQHYGVLERNRLSTEWTESHPSTAAALATSVGARNTLLNTFKTEDMATRRGGSYGKIIKTYRTLNIGQLLRGVALGRRRLLRILNKILGMFSEFDDFDIIHLVVV